MNFLLIILAVILMAILMLGLRTMQDDHLFAIGHRVELGLWFMFTLYVIMIAIVYSGDEMSFVGEYLIEPNNMLKWIFAGLMFSRILTCSAFTLGNPPKVKIHVTPKTKEIRLKKATKTPGVQTDIHGIGRVIL